MIYISVINVVRCVLVIIIFCMFEDAKWIVFEGVKTTRKFVT